MYLLVYPQLTHGGIETYIVKLCNWMVKNNKPVGVVLLRRGPLDRELDQGVRVIVAESERWPYWPGRLPRVLLPRLDGVVPRCVVAFDPRSLVLAMHINRSLRSRCRFTVGVYHPNQFFLERSGRTWHYVTAQLFNIHVRSRSKIFMNNEVLRSHAARFLCDYDGAHVVPICVADPSSCSEARRPRRFRIVSVGRLVGFKTYNLWMLDVISQLRDRGWDVTWDVYGAGPLEVAMQARIVKLQLQERVTLWGETAYRDLEQAIQSAYAFVGMGTALIEAGRCGIPSVPAIVYGGTRTYGYVYELPLGAVGEHLGPEPGIECRVLLERLLSMDDAGYEQESQRTRTYCAQYDIQQVGPRFVDAVERGDRLPTHSPRRAAALWIASWVYCVGQAYRSARNAMVRAATRLLAPSLTCRLRAMARLRQTDRESSPPK